MSDTYTKLFSSITESTVWGESYATRIVWVTMLAMADAKGAVYGSVPGLARRANVTLQEVEQALAAFTAPDAYSRTKDEDGRRIEEIDGGWRLINHAKYSAVRNSEERREYKRRWDQEHRAKAKKQSDKSDTNPTNPTGAATPAPTPAPTPEDQKQASAASPTLAGLACRLMREAGCQGTNPSHPDLQAALTEGITPETLAATVTEALEAGVRRPFAYAITTARGRHAEGARAVATGPPRIANPAAPSRQLAGVAGFLGVNAHDLAQGFSRPADVVLDADRGGAGEPVPAGPGRLSCG